jgi:hypothetical protein
MRVADRCAQFQTSCQFDDIAGKHVERGAVRRDAKAVDDVAALEPVRTGIERVPRLGHRRVIHQPRQHGVLVVPDRSSLEIAPDVEIVGKAQSIGIDVEQQIAAENVLRQVGIDDRGVDAAGIVMQRQAAVITDKPRSLVLPGGIRVRGIEIARGPARGKR